MDAPRERDYLLEIARLYAALIRVARSIDDPDLRAEVAELLWPRTDTSPPATPAASVRRMPVVSENRKFIIAAIGALATLAAGLSTANADLGDLWGQVIVAIVGAFGVWVLANTASHPAAKFAVAALTAIAAYVAYGLQADVPDPWGLHTAEGGGLWTVLGTGIVSAALVYAIGNAPTEPTSS